MKCRGRHYLMGCGQPLQSQLALPRPNTGKAGGVAVSPRRESARSGTCVPADRRGKSRK